MVGFIGEIGFLAIGVSTSWVRHTMTSYEWGLALVHLCLGGWFDDKEPYLVSVAYGSCNHPC